MSLDWELPIITKFETCVLLQVSSDMSIVDLDLPFILGFAIGATLNASTTLIVTMVVTWQVAILIFPVLYINRWLQVLCSSPGALEFSVVDDCRERA